MAEQCAEIFEHLRGQGGRAGNEQAHRSADFARCVRRRFEQADVHGGHAEEHGGTEIEKLGGGLFVLEALQQAHAESADKPAVQSVAQRVDVEERQRKQQPVGRIICQHVSRLMALAAKLLCVRMAPFEAPVVPDV